MDSGMWGVMSPFFVQALAQEAARRNKIPYSSPSHVTYHNLLILVSSTGWSRQLKIIYNIFYLLFCKIRTWDMLICVWLEFICLFVFMISHCVNPCLCIRKPCSLLDWLRFRGKVTPNKGGLWWSWSCHSNEKRWHVWWCCCIKVGWCCLLP